MALLLLCAAPRDLIACSCEWGGPFLKVAHRTDLVIRGTVAGYQENRVGHPVAMDLLVQEVLRGSTARKTVRVWGGSGSDCRAVVTGFPIGTEWIFALLDSTWEAKQDYWMFLCGEFWLRVEGEMVRGAIATSSYYAETESLGLDRLRALVRMGLRGAIPYEPPHLMGTVRVASAWSLDVEMEPDRSSKITGARVFLTGSTMVIDRQGREYPPKSIPVGTRVSVWFPGPLAPFRGSPESPFPISARVVAVVVEDPAR